MAEIRLLSPEELATREQKTTKRRSGRRRSHEREQIIAQYKDALMGAQPGFGGEVVLTEGEEKRLVRMNLTTAAAEIGKALEFRPIKDKTRIHFRVITLEERAAKPKRGGRPKKVQPEAGAPITNGVEETPAAAPGQPRRRSRKQSEAA